MLQRGGLPSEIALQVGPSSPKSCIEEYRVRTSKIKKIFSAHNDQGSMNRRKKWFSEKLGKTFDLENFLSESFSIRTSCIESSRFQARVAKGRPAFRDRITSGTLESEIVYRRVSCADFENRKKYFRLIMIRVA